MHKDLLSIDQYRAILEIVDLFPDSIYFWKIDLYQLCEIIIKSAKFEDEELESKELDRLQSKFKISGIDNFAFTLYYPSSGEKYIVWRALHDKGIYGCVVKSYNTGGAIMYPGDSLPVIWAMVDFQKEAIESFLFRDKITVADISFNKGMGQYEISYRVQWGKSVETPRFTLHRMSLDTELMDDICKTHMMTSRGKLAYQIMGY